MNTYSFSKLKCFYNCKYYYYLHYFDDDGMEPESHGTSEFGRFIHKILELYGKGELPPDKMVEYYKDNYDEFVVSDFTLNITPHFSKDMGQKYYNDGMNFLRKFTGFPFKILDTERRFEVDYEGKFLLNGSIDVVADMSGKMVIIDYKSKGKWKSLQEMKEYEKQLYIYAYAMYKLEGKFPDKMAFFLFRLNKWTWVDFDINRLKEVLQWAENTVNDIESEFEFEPVT